jgi:hypothetical protein
VAGVLETSSERAPSRREFTLMILRTWCASVLCASLDNLRGLLAGIGDTSVDPGEMSQASLRGDGS